jgi:hypothetical protein
MTTEKTEEAEVSPADPAGTRDRFSVSPAFFPGDRPAPLESIGAVFRCSRPAWSPGLLLLAWIVLICLWSMWEAVLPASGRALRAAAGLATVLLVWLLSGLAVSVLAWEFGRGERLGLFQAASVLRSRARAVLGGPMLIVVGIAAFIAALAVPPGLLAHIPVVGKVAGIIWTVVPGLPLALLAAGLALIGIPALPLVLAAGSVEEPFPFDSASRGIGYLRSRPLRTAILLVAGVLGSVAGVAVFAAFAALAALLMLLSLRLASGAGAAAAWSSLWSDPVGLLASTDLAWPFGVLGPGRGVIPILAGRAVEAFAALSLLSGLARTYLLLRWEVDGEPPGSQALPGEEFTWSRPEA